MLKRVCLLWLSSSLFFSCSTTETPTPTDSTTPVCRPTEIIDNFILSSSNINVTTSKIEYDTQGRITKLTNTNANTNSTSCGTTISNYVWANGQYTITRVFTPCGSNPTPPSTQTATTSFELYADGNLKKLYNSDNSYRDFFYNAEGYLTKVDVYDASSMKTSYVEFTYVNGNRTLDTYYYKDPNTGEFTVPQGLSIYMKYNEDQLDTFNGLHQTFYNTPFLSSIFRPLQGGSLFKMGKRNKHVMKEIRYGDPAIIPTYRLEYDITDGKLVKHRIYNASNTNIIVIDYPLNKYVCQ
jgi:hypothetical protein